MAREHPATARSSDSFTQESHSSAAATLGKPARNTTAMHANNRYVDKRFCIARGLRTLVGAAGITDHHSPDVHLSFSRGRRTNGSSAMIGHSVSASGQNRKSSMRANVFRFAPESGHRAMQSACPFRAMNGLMRRSKRHLYSIILSARPSSEGGTARPSALAALRLTR